MRQRDQSVRATGNQVAHGHDEDESEGVPNTGDPLSGSPQTEHFEQRTTAQGTEVWVYRTKRFKTRCWRVTFRRPLDSHAAGHSLAINLLRRGTVNLPSMRRVASELESLYGASWSAGSTHLADQQGLRIRLDHVEQRHLPAAPSGSRERGIDERARELFRALLYEPALDAEGLFPEAAYQTELRSLVHEHEALYDDKQSWAWRRFLEHWFPDEAWSMPSIGHRKDLDSVDRLQVSRLWRESLQKTPARLFVVGDVDAVEVCAWAADSLPLRSEADPPITTHQTPIPASNLRWVQEQDALHQARLLVGFRVNLHDLDPLEHDALALFCCVLGDGMHSRLFRNLREKHGLAYDISATLDRSKGFLVCTAGIEGRRREEVFERMEAEVRNLKQAPPLPEEFEQAKQSLSGISRSIQDSPEAMLDLLEVGLRRRRVRSPEEVARSFERVEVTDFQRAAQRVGPAEIAYCLAPQGEGS